MGKITVGLDIGFSTIKIVALEHGSDLPKLTALGTIAAPMPGMSSDGDQDLAAVASSIKKLMSASKIEQPEVVVALPESKVFTRVIDDLPFLSDSELPSAIKYASEEFIPLPMSEVNLNWQVLARGKQKSDRTVVFVVASPKQVVQKYIRLLDMADLRPLALETEIIASSRALVGNNAFSPTTLIIQMGTITTDFAIVSKGLILLTRSIATGGSALTRALAQHFGFEVAQAEEYKKVYGLLNDQLEGKVYEAIRPLIDSILEETRRVVEAYHSKNPTNKIKRVVISGGGAKMPGLVVYMANNLNLEVQEADPWYFITKDASFKAKLVQEGPIYTVAVGLALWEP